MASRKLVRIGANRRAADGPLIENYSDKAEVTDISTLRESAAKARLEDVQPLLEKVAKSDLSRAQQESVLQDIKKSSGVTLQALRADLLSELREAGVIKDDESVATVLVKLAEEAGIKLWHDPDKNPWATLRLEDHVEYHALKTKAVKRYLQGLYFEKDGSVGA